jgi:hypothetical protein
MQIPIIATTNKNGKIEPKDIPNILLLLFDA